MAGCVYVKMAANGCVAYVRSNAALCCLEHCSPGWTKATGISPRPVVWQQRLSSGGCWKVLKDKTNLLPTLTYWNDNSSFPPLLMSIVCPVWQPFPVHCHTTC